MEVVLIRPMEDSDKLEVILEKCSSVDFGKTEVGGLYYACAYYNNSENSYEAEEVTISECIDKIFKEVK